MKREVLIAIFFGLIVGLILTIGMYRARTALESIPTESPLPFIQSTAPDAATPSPVSSDSIRIAEPVVDAFVQEAQIKITGSTYPDTALVILHNEKELLSLTDSLGNFSVPVTLDPGPNIFIIRALSNAHAPQEITRTVVFEKIGETVSATPAASLKPTPSPKP